MRLVGFEPTALLLIPAFRPFTMRGVIALTAELQAHFEHLAPWAGIEPTTNALTKAFLKKRLMSVRRSTAELPGNLAIE